MKYLHIINESGKTIAVLSARKRITAIRKADLVYAVGNPLYTQEMASYQADEALPGTLCRYNRRARPEEFSGLGVLSSYRDLDKIPRFTDGQIKKEDIPLKIRGEELIAYLDRMVIKAGPCVGNLAEPLASQDHIQPKNITSWSKDNCPHKTSKATPEQKALAKDLRSQGVSWRKVAAMTRIPFGSLQRLVSSPGILGVGIP